jgi:hypothetical protein
MKKYRIVLLVPHSTEVVVTDVQGAHNEATKLAYAHTASQAYGKAVVQSIEFVEEVDEGDEAVLL